MQIVGSNADEVQKSFGRHFDLEDELVSTISRKSIDLLKENYRVRGWPSSVDHGTGACTQLRLSGVCCGAGLAACRNALSVLVQGKKLLERGG